MAFEEGVLADLVDVGAVGLHAVEVGHDVSVAHAELGLAGGREDDTVVGEVQGIDVGDAASEGELFKTGSIHIYFVDMIIVFFVLTHGEDDFVAGEVDFGVANDSLGRFKQVLDFTGIEIDGFEGAAAGEAVFVDFADLEDGGGIMMIGFILRARDKENGVFCQ